MYKFWPTFSRIMIALDVVLSLSIIVLGALTVSFANGHTNIVRGLSITSTILAGAAALIKGTVSHWKVVESFVTD